nr:unnamed protein product [Callosobruchus analis]
MSLKKDQCDFCVGFHNSIDEEKKNLQTEYDLHIEAKELSRQEKEKDKRSVDKVTAVFDLQAALPCPQADSSKFYYVSKLNTYNLTICELQSTETNCFIWHEGHDHYVTIIKQAKKRGKPYRVHEMSFSDFFDLKLMAQEIGIKDVFKNEDGEIAQLSKICAVKVTKDNPEELFYKTSFKENDFRSLVVTKFKRQCMPLKSNPILKPVYKKKVGITHKKKASLLSLFIKNKKGVSSLPQYYKDFYENL